MKNMKNKKVILSSILSLILCVSLIVGGTFALFTSESKTNIAVTSGKVNVQATLEIEDIYRPTLLNEDGSVNDANNLASVTNDNEATFRTGGSVSVNGAEVAISEMLPGDKVTFKITTTNNSTVQFKQRVELKCIDDDKSFFEQLLLGYKDRNAEDYTYYKGYATAWENSEEVYKDGNTVVEYLTVELPGFVGNEYQGKTCNIAFNVVAVQGNAATTDTPVAETYSVVKDEQGLVEQIAMAEDGAEIMVMSPITEPVVIRGVAAVALEEEVEAAKTKTVTLRGYKINSLKVEDKNTIVHVYNDVDTLIGANAVKAVDVATADDLFAVAKAIDTTLDKIKWAYYVNFVDDINLAGTEWTPINLWDPENSNVITFNGNEKTIKGMTIKETGGYKGFIGTNARDLTIENLTFANATLNDPSDFSAIVIGYQYGNVVLNNVDVYRSQIISGGNRIAGLVGFSEISDNGTSLNLDSCDVSGLVIEGSVHSVAGLVGYLNDYSNREDKWEITNCSVTNSEFTVYGGSAWTETTTAFISPFAVDGKYNVFNYDFEAAGNTESGNISNYYDITRTADGSYEIYNAEGLFGFAKQVNENKKNYSGKTVYLMADIDLENKEWTPIGQTGATQFVGIFDGQGHTISNFKVDISNLTSDNDGAGLFGWIEEHTASVQIKNVKIDRADIKGHQYAGGIVGFIGGAGAENVISGCSVTNSSISADKSVAGIVGHIGGNLTIHDIVSTGNTIAGVKAGREYGAGAIFGRSNSGTVTTMTSITIEDNTISQDNATTKKPNDYYGTSYGTTTYDGNPASSAAFAAALDNAEDGDVITLVAGYYTMVNTTKNVTITGSKDAVLSLPKSVTGSGNTITFDGITVAGYYNDADKNDWYTTQLNGAEKAVYKNCTITGLITTYCSSDFNGCEFNNDFTDQYSVYCYSNGTVNFDGCTFNTDCSKAIKIYDEANGGAGEKIVNVKDCEFIAKKSNKAAIEINSEYRATKGNYKVNISNCTINDKYTRLWNDESIYSIVTIDGMVTERVWVNDQTALNNAISGAASEKVVEVILPTGTYTAPTQSMQNKNITFTGTKETVVDLSDAPTDVNVAATGANVTFEGVTVRFDNTELYTGLSHIKGVVFKNCTIIGKQTLYADAEFINCTFVNANDYSIWTWGAENVTFTDCTFKSGGKALLVYCDTATENHTVNVTLNNCKFVDDGTLDTVKAAVEVGSNPKSNSTVYNITMNNCTVEGFAINNEGINTNTTSYGNKNSMDTEHLNVVINDVDVY